MKSNNDSKQSRVALVQCPDYDYTSVKQAVGKGLELVDFRELFKPGEKILLKPNLLAADPPDKCVTTHPAVFRATAEYLKEIGVVLSFGDSPAINSTERAARKAGILQAAQELGVELADFGQGRELVFKEGNTATKFTIANGVTECDGLVSLPKFKTHALTTITGAVKNQFGCIPGRLKSEYHVRLPFPDSFAAMLVDLNRLIRPRLYVMDAIMAMDGNGPRRGRPFKMGVLLFSTDPVALDATACRLIGLNPQTVNTIKYGQIHGLGNYDENKVDIVGDISHSTDFSQFLRMSMPVTMPLRSRRLQNSIIPRPRIESDLCQRCGLCVQMCPVKPPAIDWSKTDMPPIHRYKDCIRCYCCQEVCPEGAIKLYTPVIGRLLRPKQ